MTQVAEAPTLETYLAEYFSLLAEKAREGGLDSRGENRLRALAKEPLLARDLKRDEATAAELWAFKRDISATLPATDPTPAEIAALGETVQAARRARQLAQVDLECFEFRIKRLAANGLADDRSAALNKVTEMKRSVGQAKNVSAAADQQKVVAAAVPRIRQLVNANPQLADALGLNVEAAAAPERPRRKSV